MKKNLPLIVFGATLLFVGLLGIVYFATINGGFVKIKDLLGLNDDVYYPSRNGGEVLRDIYVTELDPPTIGIEGKLISYNLQKNDGGYELLVDLEVEGKLLKVKVPYFFTNKVNDKHVISLISDGQAGYIQSVLNDNKSGQGRESGAILGLIAINSLEDQQRCKQRLEVDTSDWCLFDPREDVHTRDNLLKIVKSTLVDLSKQDDDEYNSLPVNIYVDLTISYAPSSPNI